MICHVPQKNRSSHMFYLLCLWILCLSQCTKTTEEHDEPSIEDTPEQSDDEGFPGSFSVDLEAGSAMRPTHFGFHDTVQMGTELRLTQDKEEGYRPEGYMDIHLAPGSTLALRL